MPSLNNSSLNDFNQYELSSRLLSLTENTSYTLTQINGQRIYKKAPGTWKGPEPNRKCEVFIGRIPHDCFEDVLVPLFQTAGELFEFRLMINFSGWNRGYAFAMYITETEANNAICMFNNFMIRPSWQLGVCPSINNCRIFVSRLATSTSSVEIIRMLYALTEEIQEIRIRRNSGGCSAIVEYKSHRGAAIARKTMLAAATSAWGTGTRPAVDWSLPHSPQLLKQYREVGHWTPERGVEIYRLPEEPEQALSLFYKERSSRAHRLLMIHKAQRGRTFQALPKSDPAQLPALLPPEFSISQQPQSNAVGDQQLHLLLNYQNFESAPYLNNLTNGESMTSNVELKWLNAWNRSWNSARAPETPAYNPWTTPRPLCDPRDNSQPE